MTTTPNALRRAVRAAGCGALALAALVAGCGGGGGSAGSAPDAAATPSDLSVTVAQFAAGATGNAGTPLTTAAAGTQAQSFNDSRLLAARMLADALDQGGNAMAVPPLLYTQLDLWRAAASGSTLDSLNQLFPLPADATLRQTRTLPVKRQLWAQRGQTFLPAFLSASQLPALLDLGARWSAAETGLADGSWPGDTALTQALSAYAVPVAPSASDFSRLRLWVLDGVQQALALPPGEAFNGVFAPASGGFLAAPMLRWTAGVRQVRGVNFSAQVLSLGPRRLVALQPAPGAGSLRAYVGDGRFVMALDEVTGQLAAGHTEAGTLVLPAGVLSLAAPRVALLPEAGLSLPFDRINANFRALDGRGGTHVEALAPSGRLDLGATAATFTAAATSSFVFDPGNVNQGSGSFGAIVNSPSGGFTLLTPVIPGPCPQVEVDLLPHYLVLIDEFNAVQWVAAIGLPNNAGACVLTLQNN